MQQRESRGYCAIVHGSTSGSAMLVRKSAPSLATGSPGVQHPPHERIRLALPPYVCSGIQGIMRIVALFAMAGLYGAGPVSQARPDRWILVYKGGSQSPAYSVNDLLHLVSAVDTSGQPRSWLCTGAVLLALRATSGRNYYPLPDGAPADGDDWTKYLDSLFARGGPLVHLDSAVALIDAAVGTPGRRLAVAIMIPYPHPRSDSLRFNGQSYRLSSDLGRGAAVTAYVHEVERRFNGLKAPHLSFQAFYWLNEGVTAVDTALVPKVSSEVHRLGARFLWIPSFGAAGAARWRVLGFDQAWLQPNYFFHPDVPVTRLDTTVAIARASGMGLEIEFDRRMFTSWQFRDRLEPYLAALEDAPDLRAGPLAIYDGAGTLYALARAKDGWHRALYERFVAVLQGS